MIQVYKSKFTPGATGDQIHFRIGEIVKYQLRNGDIIDIKIDSERMSHDNCDVLGYEAIFLDDNQKYFARGDKIIGWEGKVC